MTQFFLPALFACSALLLGSCGVLAPHEEDVYPTTIEKLTPAEQNARQEAFVALNDGEVCTPIGVFGFTDWDLGLCVDQPDRRPTELGSGEALSYARTFLVRNERFTGVSDPSELVVKRTPGGRVIKFENQRYQGLEVEYTQILFDPNWRDSQGRSVAVGGNWYPEIYIPDREAISPEEAQQRLIGTELDYGWGALVLTVSAASFPEHARVDKLILPVSFEDRIELRVAWKVEVYPNAPDRGPDFSVYVDTMTGEQLQVDQLIIIL
ncbi:MAG: hypothetical protein ACR2GR_05660 [Rhodothermales bacterium]